METASQTLTNVLKKQNILRALTYLNLAAYLWPQQAVIKDDYSVDIIVVGAGTAGCIITSRLVKNNVRVLLIEAGDQPPVETQLTGLFMCTTDTAYDFNFTSVRNETTMRNHKDEVTKVHQGKLLGGSSQMGYALYGIGNPQDYQEWVDITNDPSWSYKELCPLIRRTEKVIDRKILNSPDVFFRGTKGNIKINKYSSKINDGFFESYKELGFKVLNDINPNNTVGVTNAYFTIGDGIRESTAYGFLSPEKDNPYLEVMYNSLATKIIFDEQKRAVGVQVLTKDKKFITVKANKEVIITAGTIKTPQLLMLSGIGPKAHLEEKGIKVIEDLPVGQNFQDHPTNVVLHKLGEAKSVPPPDPHQFPVEVMEGRIAVNNNQKRADYLFLSGIVADSNFLEICTSVFNFKNELCDGWYKQVYNSQIHFITHNLLYSESRGEIILNSTDPEDKPIIDPKYYSHENDLERHAKYLEHFNVIVNTKYYKSLNAELVDPGLETLKGLEKGSVEYWKKYALGMATTLHNYVGTCAMGSVVDSKLRVKGVKGLRVGDASVMPKIVGSTVQGTVMVIAQKLSDLLAKHYKLCLQ